MNAHREPPPLLVADRLFRSELLRIERVVARPTTDRPTDERPISAHGLVLPYRGVFATHAGRGVPVVATPSHAVLLSASIPYRYSYPGAIGDHCLVLLWSDEAADRAAPGAGRRAGFDALEPGTAPVLDAAALLARERLRGHLGRSRVDPLAIEECAVVLLAAALRAVRREPAPMARHPRATVRARVRVERVKQLVGVDPARRWTLDALASAANVSPYHLAREFKARVGLSVYEYVLRARLAAALPRLLDSPEDLDTIALDAGFSSHSHFTAQFRARFGTTPHALRRSRDAGDRDTAAQFRRIATAEPRRLP